METKLQLKEMNTYACLVTKCLFILNTEDINIYLLSQICQLTYFPILYLVHSFSTGQTSLIFLRGTVCILNFIRCLSASVSGREICINYNTVT